MKTLVELKTPSRLIARTLRQDAWSIFTKVLSLLMPALLTRMSMWPKAPRTSWAIRKVSGKSLTSARTARARRPRFSISATTAWAAASLEM